MWFSTASICGGGGGWGTGTGGGGGGDDAGQGQGEGMGLMQVLVQLCRPVSKQNGMVTVRLSLFCGVEQCQS
jgi:hypothetical protein